MATTILPPPQQLVFPPVQAFSRGRNSEIQFLINELARRDRDRSQRRNDPNQMLQMLLPFILAQQGQTFQRDQLTQQGVQFGDQMKLLRDQMTQQSTDLRAQLGAQQIGLETTTKPLLKQAETQELATGVGLLDSVANFINRSADTAAKSALGGIEGEKIDLGGQVASLENDRGLAVQEYTNFARGVLDIRAHPLERIFRSDLPGLGVSRKFNEPVNQLLARAQGFVDENDVVSADVYIEGIEKLLVNPEFTKLIVGGARSKLRDFVNSDKAKAIRAASHKQLSRLSARGRELGKKEIKAVEDARRRFAPAVNAIPGLIPGLPAGISEAMQPQPLFPPLDPSGQTSLSPEDVALLNAEPTVDTTLQDALLQLMEEPF